jgi:N-acetylmuramoyl-L-alanine amidase
MSDDNRQPPATPDDFAEIPEIAPSTIFVELMRQAAARRTAEMTPAPPPIEVEPYLDTESAAPIAPPPQKELPPPPPSRPVRQRLRLEPSELPPLAPKTEDEEPTPLPEPAPTPVAATPQPVQTEQMEAQRIQRVQRRREKVQRRRAGMFGGFFRTVLILVIAGGLASTIFTWFTSPDFLDRRVASSLVVAESTLVSTVQATVLPTPNYLKKIGIVSGHRGPSVTGQEDPGAVCDDGLTEASINFEVATRVVRTLRGLGYSVDLLDEFDERLNNYQAAALVSIHANTCRDFGERVSGFLVAKAAVRPQGGIDDLLAECIGLNYGNRIGLERRFNLTVDMTDYHTFREIHPLTPAAIIELGFMKDDREVLTTRQDDMAQAITEGILCFLSPDPNQLLATPDFFINTATPSPSP